MFRNRFLIIFLALIAPCFVHGDEWLGHYLQGSKIGYSYSNVVDDTFKGVPCSRSDTHTLMAANLLGSTMSMDMKSTTWVVKGKPKKMLFTITSAGRTQSVIASFLEKTILVNIDNAGTKSHRTLNRPTDAPIVDDALTAMLMSKASSKKSTFYVLDPLTASLVKNTATDRGYETIEVDKKKVRAHRVDIEEVRATTKMYVDAKGNLIIAYGPLGIEMRPVSRALALKDTPLEGRPDLATVSSIRPDKEIEDPQDVRLLHLRISGKDLSKVPSGDHQTVTKDAAGWLIDVHPSEIVEGYSIEKAMSEKPDWVKPSLNIPSDSREFTDLAAKVVGDSKSVAEACEKVRSYVNGIMRPNSGIGVVRNASEVLKTKEGVCRDYAILTCTILRAARVPARLASGIVYQNGVFYYHAWVEGWNGGKWIGVDSTRPSRQITATHVKLAEGNVDEAFVFTFLEDSKISVLGVER
jgi:hypothetical protein